jgi:hypothetical protein
MGLSLLGILPVSALNIGLAASLPALTARIDKLTLDVTNLGLVLAHQIQLGLTPPDLTGLVAGIGAQIAALPTLVLPSTWVTAGVSANLDIGIQLGLIELKLAAALALSAQFEAGLTAPGISLWSYSGAAPGFGAALSVQTATGWGSIPPTQEVQGVVISTESAISWLAFGKSFRTGASGRSVAGPDAHLVYEGTFGGGQLSTGVLSLSGQLELAVLDLKGLRASLSAQLQVSLGLNLPSLSGLVASLEAIIPSVALENMLTVKTDIGLAITGLLAEIQVTLALIFDLTLQLSAGGLTVWLYSGPAGGLGAGLRAATAGGLPGGSGPLAPTYGIALAVADPAVGAAFGQIFRMPS